MKRKIMIMIITLLIAFSLFGCDSGKSDVTITNEWHINTSDEASIDSYNGYKCISSNIIYDKNTDTYTCTVKFSKVFE